MTIPKIKSEITINGKKINQDLIPKETVAKMVEETIHYAGLRIGIEINKKKKTA